jgi:hypothetical protein
MVTPSTTSIKPVTETEIRDLAELEASRRTMVETMCQHIDWYVKIYGVPKAEAAEQVRIPAGQAVLERPPEHVTWWDVQRALETDAAQGQALWQRVKEEARRELRVGVRQGKSLERRVNSTPYERAEYLVILESLIASLEPRDGLEMLLVQQMASAHEQHLRWQTVAAHRIEEESWQGERDRRRALERMRPADRERYQSEEGWLPPRQTDAEAIEQAVLLADRYQRSFLRMVKAFRDNRRTFGSLVVAGGQVNIGEQQVNVAK